MTLMTIALGGIAAVAVGVLVNKAMQHADEPLPDGLYDAMPRALDLAHTRRIRVTREVEPLSADPASAIDEDELDLVTMILPEGEEAMQQLREAIAGRLVKCAVCQTVVPDMIRVRMHDDSAFCCHVCAAILNAGAPS